MTKWEGSAADKAADKRNAKKHGMTVKQWEGSPGDERADAEARRNTTMKMPMTDKSTMHMGPHIDAKVKSVSKSGGPNNTPASRADQVKSGGPGVGSKGGMSHAVATLAKMKH